MSYEQDPFYEDTPLGRHVHNELLKIADELRTNLVENIEFKIWNVEPDKPRTGQSYYADGTNWNPGSGEGLYIYKSGGSWVLLG